MNTTITPASGEMTFSTSTPSSSHGYTQVVVPDHLQFAPKSSDRGIETAVYNYIRAIRALGRTTLGVIEIAKALSLTVEQVQGTLQSLHSKGVKIA
jgi:hypothetical protein